jgi:hypothetical protein
MTEFGYLSVVGLDGGAGSLCGLRLDLTKSSGLVCSCSCCYTDQLSLKMQKREWYKHTGWESNCGILLLELLDATHLSCGDATNNNEQTEQDAANYVFHSFNRLYISDMRMI